MPSFLAFNARVHCVAFLMLLVPASSAWGANASPTGIEFRETDTGIRYGIWSRSAAANPAPVLFIIANSIEETLGSVHFRQAGNFLAPEGWICVALDLPCHGRETRSGERTGLAGWRQRLDHDDNIVADSVGRLRQVLDQLIADGLADPKRIAAVGTSRGGFIALHFAAAEPRVKAVAAFAPVTDLAVLTEFKGAEDSLLVQNLALERQAGALSGRAIWIVIGDRDIRVGTDDAIRFARRVTAAALAQQLPALVEFHVVAEPRGHSVPAGWTEQAASWIRKQFP